MRALLIVAVAFAAGAIGVFNPARSHQPPANLPDLAAPEAAKPYGVGKAPFAQRASTSCAGASCHGGGQVGAVGSEHSTWARELPPRRDPDDTTPPPPTDPHARAYSVLFNEVSVRMGKALGIKEPHKEKRCLACHAVDSAKDAETRDQILSEGVGCGGCHGPADKWVSEHTLPSWKARGNREKWEQFGFVPTKSLVARSLVCAGCHVGDGARDMNHDMIAAGHPRLAFEPARFHHQPGYRKHWAEKGSPRDFEVRLWVVGQAATLRAAANLLHERATKVAAGDKNSPWPEFSGYSCYACHQPIGDTETRGSLSASARPPGVPGWEVWSNATADVAVKSCDLAFPGLSSPEFTAVKDLRALMESKRAPAPTEVAKAAKAAVAELDRWLAEVQAAEERTSGATDETAPAKIAGRLVANALAESDPKRLRDHDWDALAANYLGVAAMYHATGGRAGPAAGWSKPLSAVGTELRFPDGYNGPAKFGRLKLDLIRDNFDALRKTTGTPEGK